MTSSKKEGQAKRGIFRQGPELSPSLDLLEQSHVAEPSGKPVVTLKKRIEVFGGADVPAVLVVYLRVDGIELLSVEGQEFARVQKNTPGEASVRVEVHSDENESVPPLCFCELDSELDFGLWEPDRLYQSCCRKPVERSGLQQLREWFPPLGSTELDKEIADPPNFVGRVRHTSSF